MEIYEKESRPPIAYKWKGLRRYDCPCEKNCPDGCPCYSYGCDAECNAEKGENFIKFYENSQILESDVKIELNQGTIIGGSYPAIGNFDILKTCLKKCLKCLKC